MRRILAIILLLALALAGCRTRTASEAPTAVARFLIETDSERGAVGVTLPVSGVQIRAAPKPVITEYDIAGVAEAKVDLGRCVLFQLSPAAARDLYRLTATNIGRRLVLLVNGGALGARVIDRPIEGGMLFIFLEVPDEALPDMVKELNHTSKILQREAARQG